MALARGRWWMWSAPLAWLGCSWPSGWAHAALAPVAAALALAVATALGRRGTTLWGPALSGVALVLVAISLSIRPAPPPPPRWPDLPLPRTQRPIQRVRLTEAPRPSRHGARGVARWLSSCTPGQHAACRARRGLLALTLPAAAREWGPGTQLRILGFVRPPPGYHNPGADSALTRWPQRGVVGRMHALQPGRCVVEGAAAPLSALGRRRLDLQRAMAAAAPGPAGGLLRALALGDRSGVAPHHVHALRRTGTAHVLAVSGTHVGFVLAMALLLMRWAVRRGWFDRLLRRWTLPLWQLVVGGGAVCAYAAITGAAASTVRAATVAVAALAIRAAGTRPAPVELLGVAAAAALCLDPAASGDAGLALSLLGALGALLGTRIPIRGGRLQRAFVVSLSAWATTSIVSVPLFGQLPLLAPFLNLLVVPYVGVVLLPLAVLTLLVSGWPTLACAGWLAPLARLAVAPIDAIAAVEAWPCLDVGAVDGLLLGGALSVGLLLVLCVPRYGLLAAVVVVVLACGAVVVRPLWTSPPVGAVDAFFLDVGHGDATLLRFSDGTTMLVDGGGEVGDDGRVGRAAVVPVLRAFGVRRIDHMVLSHAHPDHENGLLAVARAFPVDWFWFNGQGNRSAEHRALIEALSRAGARWQRSRDLQIAGVRVRTLWPPPSGPVAGLGLNDNSLVLSVESAGGRLLLAGDVEREAEAMLVEVDQRRAGRGQLRADLLKVPHHGSRTSSTSVFLDAVRPRLAVAGARSWGQLPFPHHDVLARYARRHVPLWQTGRGFVSARLAETGVRVRQGAASVWLPAASVAARASESGRAPPAP